MFTNLELITIYINLYREASSARRNAELAFDPDVRNGLIEGALNLEALGRKVNEMRRNQTLSSPPASLDSAIDNMRTALDSLSREIARREGRSGG